VIGRNFILKNAEKYLNTMQKISPENFLALPRHRQTEMISLSMASMTMLIQSQNPSNFVRIYPISKLYGFFH